MRVWLCLFLIGITWPVRADEWATQLESAPLQKAALGLARRAVQTYLHSGKTLSLPDDVPPALRRRGAVFVTIEKRGQITPRGCRGTLQPATRTLGEEIIRNAIGACSRDKRVPPLKITELPQCLISLTVVLQIKPIASIAQHDAQQNGLIARHGSQIGIVLPFEGREARVQEKWAKRKAGLDDNAIVQLSELIAVRFRENDRLLTTEDTENTEKK